MKKLIYTSICLLIACISAYATVNKPYLEVPTPSSIWINWKSDSETNFTLRYGTAPNNLSQSQSVSSQTLSDTGYDNNFIYSSVHLTGLVGGTLYYYQIVNDKGYQSDVYSFRTCPAAGASADDGITRYLIMGDDQLDEPRYDTLVVKAKRFIENKYGKPIQNVISSCISTGDQVDNGSLSQYENIWFGKTKYISPNLGIATTVGNHETYGTLKLNAYSELFHYSNSIQYKVASNTNDYYAYQSGTTVFIHLTTEGGDDENAAQYEWLTQVVEAANNDPSVDWIITVMHRPYQAEQYVGDISSWFRNKAYPFLITSPKMFLCIGAHHHLYARGEDRNMPVYNIISGGTAWDQYWGMSTEKDYEEVQKTITRWSYQILEINNKTKTAKVNAYSVGYTTKINDWGELNKFVWEESLPIDSFFVTKNIAAPSKPSITNVPADSVEMPYTFEGSAYSSPSGLLNNSTEFQVSSSNDFSKPTFDVRRDYEDLFGQGEHVWETVDANKNVNIFNYAPAAKTLINGTYYMRVRYRDRGLNWSEWSDTISFKVKDGLKGMPTIHLDKKNYAVNENIVVSYSNGPGNAKDWVGIYKMGDEIGNVNSTKWAYVNSASLSDGSLTFQLDKQGQYYAAFLSNDGYTELCDSVPFYVGNVPQLSSDKIAYEENEAIKVTVKSTPSNYSHDWLGVYKVGESHSAGNYATYYQYITADSAVYSINQSNNGSTLPKGYYYACYFLNDTYNSVGDTIYFSVGDLISTVSTDKSAYDLGDLVSVTFSDGPGKPKDWLGIFNKDDDPNINPLLNYVYVNGKTSGTASFTPDNLPKKAGEYFVVLFTNDSYNEISNRAYFSISSTLSVSEKEDTQLSLYPNPTIPGKETVVSSQSPITGLEIYTLKGGLIYSKRNIQENTITINHNLPAGLYLVRVLTNGRSYSLKLTVRND